MSIALGGSSGLAYLALRDLGCLRAGQTASPDLMNDILLAANQMIDSWLLNRMLVYTISIAAYNLTAGLQQYTIGPNESAPNITAPRPTRIEFANIILNTFSPNVRQELAIITDDKDWGRIRVQQIPFAIPLKLYYDGGFDSGRGFGTIYLWPGPLGSYQLELYTWQQLTGFTSLVATYIFPPGYQRLIQKSLAVEIAPLCRFYAKLHTSQDFRDYDPNMLALVQKQARQARAEVEQYNAPDARPIPDAAFLGSSGRRAGFNYGTGDA